MPNAPSDSSPGPAPQHPAVGFGEFIALMALMSSMIALSIDTMLPALTDIGAELGSQSGNANQLVISSLFLGLAMAQMIYGPLSDQIGRKPAILSGCTIFIGGCLISFFATSFDVMLIGRFLQGVGVAGARYVSISLIRDLYEGRAMARIMSFVMTIFILVPTIAPTLGQLILEFAGWRAIFAFLLILALIAIVWFWWRQPETLAPEHRVPFSPRRIAQRFVGVCSNRLVIGHSIAGGLVFSSFVGYLTSCQQILQQQYGLGTLFPLYFAMLSLPIGAAGIINGRLVMRFGMQRLAISALTLNLVTAALFCLTSWQTGGHPALWLAMSFFGVLFFCFGILLGNFNALAMEPLANAAGIGAAIVGSISTFISLSIGTMMGQAYDGTLWPLSIGYTVLGLASIMVFLWTEKGRTAAARTERQANV